MRRLLFDAVLVCLALAGAACGSKESSSSPVTIDAPPVIARVVVTPEEAPPGTEVQLAVVAHDPEGGALRYEWKGPAGWDIVGSPFEQSVVVRAPDRLDEVGLATVTVLDPGGRPAQDVGILRTTATAAGRAALTFRTVLAEPNPVVPGGVVAVAPLADSADGAGVTFAYAVADPAWKLDATSAGAMLEAPLAYDRTTPLTVTARTAVGGLDVARVVLATEPVAAPRIAALVASQAAVAPGGEVQLRAVASSPAGLPLRYAWSVAGEGWSLAASGPAATATAPDRAGAAAIVAVVVTDAAEASASAVAALRTDALAPPSASITASATALPPGGEARLFASVAPGTLPPFRFAWSVDDPAWTLTANGESAAVVAPLRYGAAAVVTATITDGAAQSSEAHAILTTVAPEPPAIEPLVASPAVVAPAGEIPVAAVASSPAGLPLSYAWSVASEGWSVSGSGATALVTAPGSPGEATLVSVEVTDAAGASSRAAVAVATEAASPSATLSASATTLPPGGEAKLFASAPPGAVAPLRFAWSVDDPGWTLAATAAGAFLEAPLRYGASALVTVTITDGAGQSSEAHAFLSTTPFTPPAVASLVASPAQVAPGGTIEVAAVASSAAGLPLAYAWTVAGAGWDVAGSGATSLVTAPAYPGSAALVAVEVMDTAGASTRAVVPVQTGAASPSPDPTMP
jgi:trimeric autotransporter adhesin